MITGNRKINENILLKNIFTQEKMEDKYIEVVFIYRSSIWNGVLPIFLVYQGFQISDDAKLDEFALNSYTLLDSINKVGWLKSREDLWTDKQKGPTYKVLKALESGIWECRVCGPVPEVNPQPSARLRDLKKMGYVISSKRIQCNNCCKSTMHDILVLLSLLDIESAGKVRTSISENLKKRIKKLLGNKEACFNVLRPDKELLIDHKFPSQRWKSGESENPDTLSNNDITSKFQLLSNQTNLWKSRFCDNCVSQNKRGAFMGINWYYEGDENWNGVDKYDENGCIGCPWYDLEVWRDKLNLIFR